MQTGELTQIRHVPKQTGRFFSAILLIIARTVDGQNKFPFDLKQGCQKNNIKPPFDFRHMGESAKTTGIMSRVNMFSVYRRYLNKIK